MKLIYLLTGVLICCCSFSNCDDAEYFSCIELKAELSSFDLEHAELTSFINAQLGTFPPNPTDADPLGHEQNLNTFASGLVEFCDLAVEVECYACIFTLPAQSHVLIQLDSFGTVVSRTLDIRTPEDMVMTLQNIHR
jgi:hypothetical protein